MPVVSTYKPLQIQPGVVHFHGIVILTSGPAIDPARTITPGVTALRNGVGLYELQFNDGVTVGFSCITFTPVRAMSGNDPFLIAALNEGGLAPGAAGRSNIRVEISDIAGTLTDPGNIEGYMYNLVRLNTTIAVT